MGRYYGTLPRYMGGIGYAGPGTTLSLGLSASPEIMKAAAEQLAAERRAFAASVWGYPSDGAPAGRSARRAPDVRVSRSSPDETHLSMRTPRQALRGEPIMRIRRGPSLRTIDY